MEIAPKLGEEVTKNSLIPILMQFLRDDVVDVRLNVLKRMNAIAPWMSSYESTLLPAITDLSKDLQWRVREAVILALPSLVSSLVSFCNSYSIWRAILLRASALYSSVIGCSVLSATLAGNVLECLPRHG
jgi:hypothetical protein